uniref:SGNH domain-containing protein n=1 Tax=Panagrolaimus davidi TaxID=227884 RepID=A0A914PZG7_9BILA
MLKICNCYRNLALCLIILYSCSIYLPEYVPKKDSFSTVEKHDPSNLTLQFYKEISTNFNSPIKIPSKWAIENDIEFAEKFYGIFMGGAIPCTPDMIQTVANKKQYCEINGTNPNGKLIGLAFGNSYAMNIATAIAANPLFEKVILVFGNGATFPDHGAFDKYLIEKLIKPLKPNVIFMVQKYYYFQKHLYKTPINKIRENKEFKNWNKILKIIQNFTSAIIINKEQIIFDYEISRDFIRRKINGLPIEARLKNPPQSPNLEAWLSSLNCPKCQFFGYREAFCDGEFCNVLDLATGLPLFRDSNHISPVGIRHLKPFIDNAIHKALNICVL